MMRFHLITTSRLWAVAVAENADMATIARQTRPVKRAVMDRLGDVCIRAACARPLATATGKPRQRRFPWEYRPLPLFAARVRRRAIHESAYRAMAATSLPTEGILVERMQDHSDAMLIISNGARRRREEYPGVEWPP
jgi:hypothetical protein